MIKLENINKYYFKNKSNENHVIKNTTIEFGEKGLVVIIGSSGSGKTTLLNIISGIDKFNSGKITFYDHEITKYKSKTWDKIRNDYVGYVFQNYNLLNDLSVSENIELALKMNGIIDKDEISKRIKYLLEAVDLVNYHDRRVDQLSGGQQQRVSFARALVKNPSVIIADEPTGNLDSKTTIEIMNIIKKLSLDKLVIMVTHEQKIAKFYADRIIGIENGKIVNDHINDFKRDLSVIQEHIIYLKDLNEGKLDNDFAEIETYSDEPEEDNEKTNVKLIKRNGTMYIKVDSKRYKRVKYIDDNSEIVLINEKHIDKKTDFLYGFELEKIITEPEIKKKGQAVSLKESIKYSFRKKNKLKSGGKLLYAVLALVGAVISINIGLLGHIYNIDDSGFIEIPRNYIRIYTDNITYDETMAFEEYNYITKINFIEGPISFHLETEKYYEIKGSIEFDAHPTVLELLDPSKIIYGVYPTEGYGVVIDYTIADKLIKKYAERGIESYEDILDSSIKLQASGNDFDLSAETGINFPIVGISNDETPSIYMKEELIYSLAISTLADYRILGEGFEMVTGVLPEATKEVVLSIESSLIRLYEVPSRVGISTGTYDVVGTYKYTEDNLEYNTSLIMITELEHLKRVYFKQNYFVFARFNFIAYTDDPDLAISELAKIGVIAKSDYKEGYDQYYDYNFEQNSAFFAFSIIGLLSSAISIYFIMRSSLLSRIYEVSIYRALGSTKNEIRKLFLIEAFITTTISSIVGFVIMMLLLLQAQSQVIEYVEIVNYSFIFTLSGIIGIYVINIVFGLLPINVLLRKTPAEILVKYDL